jgi:hypothetical protein
MWLVNLRSFLGISQAKGGKNAKRARLAVEWLEDRTTPSAITVNTLSDAPTHVGASLRDAIATANLDAAKGQSDTITFTSALAGKTITLTQGPLVLSGAGAGTITIDAGSLSSLTISGGSKYQDFIIDSGVNADFNKLTITGGRTGTDNVEANYGGGIGNSGTLTVNDSIITGNFGVNGGGVANLASGDMTLSNSTVTDNSASGSAGGIGNLGNLTLTSDSVTDNHATKQGGGIGNAGNMTVLQSTITGNVVNGNPKLTSVSGGGIGNDGTMTVSQSLIAGNSAILSAGIGNSGNMTLANSTVAGNSASTYSGGIGNSGTLTLLNSTIAGNSASQDGGVYNGDSLTLLNSIIASNHATSMPDLMVNGPTTVGGHDLIGSSAGLGSSGISNGDSFGDSVGENALLAPLGNYGGPTKTIALLPGSPALFAAGAATTLKAGVTDTTGTSITVANGSVFAASALPLLASGSYFTIQIEGEEMAVTALTPGSGTTATLTVVRGADDTTPSTHADGANVFLVSDQRGVITPFSSLATPSIGALQSQGFISVAENPVAQTAIAGQTATFTAAAHADPAATVQWQSSSNGGKTWTDVSNGVAYSGAKTDTLTVTGASGLNGDLYRAVFTNSAGTATTTAAKLKVDFVNFTSPVSQTIDAGQKVTFTSTVSANPGARVQWQVSTDHGASWTSIAAATGVTLSFVASTAENGNLYRTVFANAAGIFTTTSATLTVNPAMTVSNVTASTLTVGQSGFSGILTINGGTGPYTIKTSSGLPIGLHPLLTGNTISFTGTPSKAGTFEGSITIVDHAGTSVTKPVVITIKS